ncbi:MAG: 2-succinyl-5-enolpyruvyl-6-hydroxy-3-cyclohexene-1-carboxylic-acid synthase [Myxococcota bacterium]
MSEWTFNQRWAATIVGTLVGCGVRHAVIAPGSRSTPLALAFADRGDVKVWSVIDERSAAFFALGLAKATGAPAAVVCTSGSAGAHFLPAVMEASEGATPLVVLTADRPWELHGFGAPQTIAQVGMFGRHVRGAEALPTPDEPALAHVVAVTARLTQLAQQAPRGPVHLNVPFREPLAPAVAGPVIDPPIPRFVREGGPLAWPAEVLAAIATAKRGVIVCGPRERDDGFGAWVHALGERIGFPVLAEAASNARFGFPAAIGVADALLRNAAFAERHRPDVVLRFGGGLTPKGPQAWLDGSGAKIFQFHTDGLQFDPSHVAALSSREPERVLPPAASGGERAVWLEAQAKLSARLEAERAALTEPLVARTFVAALPEDTQVFLSSSMPIRDVDAFASSGRRLRVFTNRGVNGIDGVTSTALGVAAGSGRATAMLIGDVACLHDLGGWLIAKRHALSLTAVVVNNDGGGIFHFLPIAGRTPHFEDLFGTPHGVELAHLAALAGGQLHRPTSLDELGATVSRCVSGGGLHLVEVRTDRAANVDAHRALFARLSEGL